jgi:hypothetical protein
MNGVKCVKGIPIKLIGGTIIQINKLNYAILENMHNVTDYIPIEKLHRFKGIDNITPDYITVYDGEYIKNVHNESVKE